MLAFQDSACMRDWEMSLCDILCSLICPRPRLGVTCTPKVRVRLACAGCCWIKCLTATHQCHTATSPPCLLLAYSHTALCTRNAHLKRDHNLSINHIHKLPRTLLLLHPPAARKPQVLYPSLWLFARGRPISPAAALLTPR